MAESKGKFGKNIQFKTGECRFHYPSLFEKTEYEGKEFYSLTLLIPKDTSWISDLTKAIDNAVLDGKDNLWGGRIPKTNFFYPLQDGDDEKAYDYEEFEGMMFIKAKSTNFQPKVFKKESGKLVEITNREELYAGCWGKAVITLKPYLHAQGGKGIIVNLNSCMKLRDDAKIDTGYDAKKDYEDELENNEKSDAEDFLT